LLETSLVAFAGPILTGENFRDSSKQELQRWEFYARSVIERPRRLPARVQSSRVARIRVILIRGKCHGKDGEGSSQLSQNLDVVTCIAVRSVAAQAGLNRVARGLILAFDETKAEKAAADGRV
jgi:hypothetical protein